MSRVLVVSHYADPEPQPKAGELARALAGRGHDVRLVTGLPTYPSGRIAPGYRQVLRSTSMEGGIRTTRTFELPYRASSPASRALNLASTGVSMALAYSRDWAPDAVYVWSPPPTSVLPAHVLARSGRRPRRDGGSGPGRARIVMDIQDLWPDFGVHAGVLDDRAALRVLRRVERAAYRGADRLVVPTDGYRRDLLAKGVPDARIEVLPNWIADADAEPPDPAAVAATRTAEGWDGRFVVLFAGNLGHAQDLDVVLDAAAACDRPEVLVAFAGDGADAARLAARAEALGIGERVRFLGRRPAGSMPVLAGAADALVVHLRPSPLAEVATPTKVNAYLAFGRPILCALGGEGAALVRRADAGVVVAPGDPVAMAAAMTDLVDLPPAARGAMGERGRRFARANLVQSVLLDAYETVLGLAWDRPAAAALR
ncbi:MAG: glycosyltransferase family 4 protein [Acidimicrobiales bacterium]|nr:glycosyltransferase family 4 protein [Acidimicrobiales bacterium]